MATCDNCRRGTRRLMRGDPSRIRGGKSRGSKTPEVTAIEQGRLQRADVVIAVLSSPVEHPSINEWEMHLSAVPVCTTLLYAAQSFGYAAQWLTEWYAYDDDMLTALGSTPGHDQIAGFIYIEVKRSKRRWNVLAPIRTK